jgi:hypothetical protein
MMMNEAWANSLAVALGVDWEIVEHRLFVSCRRLFEDYLLSSCRRVSEKGEMRGR